MERVFVIGVGQTRFGLHRGVSASALREQAVTLALLDAGLSKSDVGAAFDEEHEAACLHRGWTAVRGGLAQVVLVAAGRSGGDAVAYPWAEELAAGLRAVEQDRTPLRVLAGVAAKNRRHGALNPRACCREPLTLEQVLSDEPLVGPLTRSMCARPSEGAAAVLLCSEAFLGRLGTAAPVEFAASAFAPATAEGESAAVAESYGCAGLEAADLDVAEVHDLTSHAELRLIEALGLCPLGAAGALAEAGETALGGRIPVNPSGGLEAQGYSGDASGLAQVHELVTQLRGRAGQRQVDGARAGVALAGGAHGGTGATTVCVLQRVRR